MMGTKKFVALCEKLAQNTASASSRTSCWSRWRPRARASIRASPRSRRRRRRSVTRLSPHALPLREQRKARVSPDGRRHRLAATVRDAAMSLGSSDTRKSEGRNRHERSHGRLVVIGAGLRRRRAGQPADRERPPSGAAAGGGRRDASALARADQLCALHQSSRRELALCLRAGAEHRRAQHPGAARKNARRIERDQRHGVGARAAPGLRPLGAARKPRLELARRAAAVQRHRELSRRRRTSCAAAAGPCGSPTSTRAGRSTTACSRRRRASGSRTIATTTAPTRRASR